MTPKIKPLETPFDVSPLDHDGELAFVISDTKGKSVHITAGAFTDLVREVTHRGDVVSRDYSTELAAAIATGRDAATREMRFQ